MPCSSLVRRTVRIADIVCHLYAFAFIPQSPTAKRVSVRFLFATREILIGAPLAGRQLLIRPQRWREYPRHCVRILYSRARYARQPPQWVMSSALMSAVASQRNPFTFSPLASVMVPMQSGGGTAATKLPNAAVESSQTSRAMAAPFSDTRARPGFGGVVLGS